MVFFFTFASFPPFISFILLFYLLETVSPFYNYVNDAYTMRVDGWTVFLPR